MFFKRVIIIAVCQYSDFLDFFQLEELATLYSDIGQTIVCNAKANVYELDENKYRFAVSHLMKARDLWDHLCEQQQQDNDVYFDPFGLCLVYAYAV